MKTALTAQVTVEQLEAQFTKLAQEIYQQGERRLLPTWPWVLIRVVPKEQQFGHLYLPDSSGSSQQNKPLHEGIVLATWKAHWSKVRGKFKGWKEVVDELWRESEYKPGDRLLYPGFAGLPTPFLDEKKYRVVREWTFDENGGVLGHLHYAGDKKYKPILDELFEDIQSITLSGK